MKFSPALAAIFTGLSLAIPLRAHRVEGLLQSSLVEVLPSQIGVEVTLAPGMDVAPKVVALLDANGDGVLSEAESTAWSTRFMPGQNVTVDGHSLPLNLKSVRISPLAEMSEGHAEIVVQHERRIIAGVNTATKYCASSERATNWCSWVGNSVARP